MQGPLFSAYSRGENRVTASIIAVLERVEIALLRRILEAAVGGEVPLVTFRNQTGGFGTSVPDAQLTASFNYLLETKLTPGTLHQGQIDRHLDALDGSHAHERLIILTPDAERPDVLLRGTHANRHKITWFNFRTLNEAITAILGDDRLTVSELQRYLLRELQDLLAHEGLIDFADVVIVPASEAYGVYLERAVYVCQAGRSFRRGVHYVAFYADGEIKRHVARVMSHEDGVVISEGGMHVENHGFPGEDVVEERASRFNELLEVGVIGAEEPFQIFWLSYPTDTNTVMLSRPIRNARADASGRGNAWARNQRYAKLRNLQAGFTDTDQLEDAEARSAR